MSLMTVTPKTLAPVYPNAGIRAAYQKRLDALVNEMAGSVLYWVKAAYRANTPEMAQDASPAREMQAAMRTLSRRWVRKFNRISQDLAQYFATGAQERVDGTMAASLAKNDFTVKFRPTLAANDAYQAVVGENVGLIRSIPQKYLSQVEGQVMRSVAIGGDLGTLTAAIEREHGLTRRRAALIARDQNNKATAVFQRVRQDELGITEAKWRHTGGAKEPRPDHVAYSGKLYNVKEGALISGKRIWPGTEINCGCISLSVLPSFPKRP